MSAKTDTGGCALPAPESSMAYSHQLDQYIETTFQVEPGMTLLDHFAGLAMQAHISRISADDKTIAEWAYDNAAAMVAEKRRREDK